MLVTGRLVPPAPGILENLLPVTASGHQVIHRARILDAKRLGPGAGRRPRRSPPVQTRYVTLPRPPHERTQMTSAGTVSRFGNRRSGPAEDRRQCTHTPNPKFEGRIGAGTARPCGGGRAPWMASLLVLDTTPGGGIMAATMVRYGPEHQRGDGTQWMDNPGKQQFDSKDNPMQPTLGKLTLAWRC